MLSVVADRYLCLLSSLHEHFSSAGPSLCNTSEIFLCLSGNLSLNPPPPIQSVKPPKCPEATSEIYANLATQISGRTRPCTNPGLRYPPSNPSLNHKSLCSGSGTPLASKTIGSVHKTILLEHDHTAKMATQVGYLCISSGMMYFARMMSLS